MFDLLREKQAELNEIYKSLDVTKIQSPKDAISYFTEKIKNNGKESFICIALSTSNAVIAHKTMKGTVDRVAVYPREIVEFLLNKKATGVITLHNHPSMDVEPSTHDIALHGKLRTVCDALDIRFLDNIIVSKTDNFSFVKEGLI